MTQEKNSVQEAQSLSALALQALKLASLEARKIAIQTNTNLIIYDPKKGIQKIPASELTKG